MLLPLSGLEAYLNMAGEKQANGLITSPYLLFFYGEFRVLK